MSEEKYRFEEIIGEIRDLLGEALDLVPDGFSRSRAESYWYANMIVNVTEDHGYMSSSMCSMEDTLAEFDDHEEDCEVELFYKENVAVNNLPNEGPINDEDWDHEAGRPAHMRDEDWD